MGRVVFSKKIFNTKMTYRIIIVVKGGCYAQASFLQGNKKLAHYGLSEMKRDIIPCDSCHIFYQIFHFSVTFFSCVKGSMSSQPTRLHTSFNTGKKRYRKLESLVVRFTLVSRPVIILNKNV